MDRIVQRVMFEAPKQERLKRVAAYSRVSNGKDTMLHSLSAQVSYYSNLIQNHEGWIYCGVYSDEALTGTKENRDDLQRLIEDCRAGKGHGRGFRLRRRGPCGCVPQSGR